MAQLKKSGRPRQVTRYRIYYNDQGNKGGTIFVGGKKTIQKKLKKLRKGSSVKWTARKVKRNVWVQKR